MRSFLCDFTEELDEIKNVLEYRFSYQLEDLVKEFAEAGTKNIDKKAIENADKKEKEKIHYKYAECFIDVSKQLIRYWVVNKSKGYKHICFDESLISVNFAPERVRVFLSYRKSIRYSEIDGIVNEYINITVPRSYSKIEDLRKELVEKIKKKYESYCNENSKLKCMNILDDIYRAIYISFEKRSHHRNSGFLDSINKYEENDIQSESMTKYEKAIKEVEKSEIYLSCDMEELIREVEINNHITSILLNVLQLKLCDAYNENVRYTKYPLEHFYNECSSTIRNGAYKRYCNSDIRKILMSMCNDKTKNIGKQGRWCYLPFYGIDYIALMTKPFAKYNKKNVVINFRDFIIDNIDFDAFIEDIIVKNRDDFGFQFAFDTLPGYIKKQLKNTQIEVFTVIVNKWISDIRDRCNSEPELFEKLISEYTVSEFCDINYSIIEEFMKNMPEGSYHLYNVNLQQLMKEIEYRLKDVNNERSHNTKKYSIHAEIKLLTPYMVERIYGVNIFSVIFEGIYDGRGRNISSSAICKIMQMQNAFTREALAKLYVNGEIRETDIDEYAIYDSKWLYPLIMCYIQLLEKYFKKNYNIGDDFSKKVSKVIVNTLGTTAFTLNYYDFDKKKISRKDEKSVGDIFEDMWNIYDEEKFNKVFDVDFFVPISFNMQETLLYDYVKKNANIINKLLD